MSDTTELVKLSAAEMAARVKTGEVSSRELVEAHLAVIDAAEPSIKAFLKVSAAQALAQADAFAAKSAVAGPAAPPTAVGEFASGSHVLLWGDGLTAPEVQPFLLEHHPDLWRPLLRLLTEIGAHIK